MPDAVVATDSPLDASDSWRFDLVRPAEMLRLGVVLSFAPPKRRVAICLEGLRGRESVVPISGLSWSEPIGAPFTYFPGPDRTFWFSPHITFPEPVDHVRVTALHWPARLTLSSSEVTRVFLRVPDASGTKAEAATSSLYLATPGGGR